MRLFILMMALLALFLAHASYASTLSVVDSSSCKKLRGTNAPFILALKKGENLNQAIVQCANDANLSGASLSGIGAIENPTFHYYDENSEQNAQKTFHGLFELIALNGNLFFSNGKREAHIHAVAGKQNYQAFGGNLDNATVGVLAEITFIPLQGQVIKKYDPQTGFDLLYAGS